jgi:hypothetical protein
MGMPIRALLQKPTVEALSHLVFPLSARTDGYALVFLFIAALTAYGSWQRARYFGNTAPLVTAFLCVLMFALMPAARLWDATLGLSFTFIFIGGVAADLLETGYKRAVMLVLIAGFLVRIVLTLPELKGWIGGLG